jgi:hypothetical protein
VTGNDRAHNLNSAFAKLSGDELEALIVFFVRETKYLEMLDSAIAGLKENDPIRYMELAEAAPSIIVERLIADALGGEQDKEKEADEDD